MNVLHYATEKLASMLCEIPSMRLEHELETVINNLINEYDEPRLISLQLIREVNGEERIVNQRVVIPEEDALDENNISSRHGEFTYGAFRVVVVVFVDKESRA